MSKELQFREGSVISRVYEALERGRAVPLRRLERIDSSVNLRDRLYTLRRKLARSKAGKLSIDNDAGTVRLLRKRVA